MEIYKQLPTESRRLDLINFKQEAYLEGFLLDNGENIFSIDEKDNIEVLDRQVGFISNKERIDILLLNARENNPEIVIVELKKDVADEKALEQINRYLVTWKKDRKEILQGYEEVLKEWELTSDIENVKGILVAPEFDESIIEELKENKIQGVRIRRYKIEQSEDIFIFIDYLPVLKEGKYSRVEVSSNQFWESRRKYRDKVESILKELKDKASAVVWKYWQSGISIYSGSSGYSIGGYGGYFTKMWIKTSIKPARYENLDLEEREKITNLILEAKRKADEL